ncbi:hypothetical protein [Algoriphagus boritolerans]|uniref:hypothetical protein n=1 Tax=Algoriphagus boritolerans TaxID=308111 RepID=UPI000ABF9C34
MQIYKLDKGKLYVDDMNSFRDSPIITYKSTPLSEDFALLAQNLRDAFPESYLLPRGLEFIACPNCAEEGATIWHLKIGKASFGGKSEQSLKYGRKK